MLLLSENNRVLIASLLLIEFGIDLFHLNALGLQQILQLRVLQLKSLQTGQMILLYRLDFLQIIGLQLSSNSIQLLLLITLHIQQLIPQLLLLLL